MFHAQALGSHAWERYTLLHQRVSRAATASDVVSDGVFCSRQCTTPTV